MVGRPIVEDRDFLIPAGGVLVGPVVYTRGVSLSCPSIGVQFVGCPTVFVLSRSMVEEFIVMLRSEMELAEGASN